LNSEEENQYVAELARISSTSFSITMRIVDIQLAMLLRDLGIKGESQTLIGKVKMNGDGNLVIDTPNSQIKKMLNKRHLVNKLLREAGS
jgi:hypothetical protein